MKSTYVDEVYIVVKFNKRERKIISFETAFYLRRAVREAGLACWLTTEDIPVDNLSEKNCVIWCDTTINEDSINLRNTLDKFNINYLGPTGKQLENVRNKLFTKKTLAANSIRVPKEVSLQNLFFPCIAKDATGPGGSKNVQYLESMTDYERWAQRLNIRTLMLEEFIDGPEFTVWVIDSDATTYQSVVVEIDLQGQPIYSTELKHGLGKIKGQYDQTKRFFGFTKYPAILVDQIRNTALSCHRILKLRHISRVDIRLKGEQIYVIEVNPLPNLNPNSGIPPQMGRGKSFSTFLQRLINVGHD